MSNNTQQVTMRFGILCGTASEVKEIKEEPVDKYLYSDVDEVL